MVEALLLYHNDERTVDLFWALDTFPETPVLYDYSKYVLELS